MFPAWKEQNSLLQDLNTAPQRTVLGEAECVWGPYRTQSFSWAWGSEVGSHTCLGDAE